MKAPAIITNIFFSFTLLWLCFVMAWQLLQSQSFHYSFWYQQLSINEHIQKYAPRNRLGKKNFRYTEQAQHITIFTEVVQSIGDSGKGLADIDYHIPNDSTSYPMFTQAEVIHLQDVANLLDLMTTLGMVITLIFIIALLMICWKKIPLAKVSGHLCYGLLAVVVSVVLVFVMGAKNVFYWLHIKIFPDNHQWFFLYEESLMSTFMKAPVLFAPIALSWLVFALLLWVLALVLIARLLKRFNHSHNNNRN